MDTHEFISKRPTTLSEVNEILKNFQKPPLSKLTKQSLKAILRGFQVIVEMFEDQKDEGNYEIALQWLRMYMKIQIQMTTCETKLAMFFETVPSALTYIIGWMLHGPSEEPKFMTEVLQISYKLVSLTNPEKMKPLEIYGKNLINLLWANMNRVGQFAIQMQILHLFVLILKNLNDDFCFWEVQNIPNLHSDEIKYKVLDLLRMENSDIDFKNLARKILNIYNLNDQRNAKVRSFHCKNILIGGKYKFTKPTHADRFWFDINNNPYTLCFEGRFSLVGNRKFQNVDVILDIKDMCISDEKLIIEFESAAKMSGAAVNDAFMEQRMASIEMTKTELKRLQQLFKIPFKNTKMNITPTFKGTKPKTASIVNSETPRMCEDTPISPMSKYQKQILKVKPLYPHKILNKSKKSEMISLQNEFESENIPNAHRFVDLYDDIDVSDAEPCQSYRTFKSRKSTARTAQLKRKLPHEQIITSGKRANIMTTDNYEGPSTSKGIIASAKYSLEMDDFDKLKSDVAISKEAHQTAIVDLSNDPKSDDEISIIETADPDTYTINISESRNHTNIVNINPGNQMTSMLRPNTDLENEITIGAALVEYNAPLISNQHTDSLVYYQRSDTDSSDSVDKSDRDVYKRRKRSYKSAFSQKANAKQYFFGKKKLWKPTNSEISDSDCNDCDVIEVFYMSHSHTNNNGRTTNIQGNRFRPYHEDLMSMAVSNLNRATNTNGIEDVTKYLRL